MTTQKTLKRLHSLIWALIYGGLFALVFGLAMQAQDESSGLWLVIGGGVVAAIGCALIFVRARLHSTERS